ncbi:hypothetical protein ACGFYY_18725 [Streptomyces sp. NPDC048331]|uniref:hypothetical protein n=1 Tax=Streptomyces sp. NPDC048331 TaxID=3365534 RepID=UPI0037126FBB
MTTESVAVRRGVPEGAAARVAEPYWEAFGGKLGLALGPPEAGRRFIAGHPHTDRAVTALSGGEGGEGGSRGRVVGVAGFQPAGRGLVGGSGWTWSRRTRGPGSRTSATGSGRSGCDARPGCGTCWDSGV